MTEIQQAESSRKKTSPSPGAEEDGKVLAPIEGEYDAVFGEMNGKGPNYRAVGWLATSVLMMKTQLGLGVLSIPFVFQTLGIVPGVLCMYAVAAITAWSAYIVGMFKLRHRDVYSLEDVGRMMFGRVGAELFAFAFVIFTTFVVGSAILSVSIGLNAVSMHGTCTAVFVAVAAIITFLSASIKTLGNISWLGWIGLVSILASIWTLTISVGVQDRPSEAPATGDWDKEIYVTNSPTFAEAISAVSSLILSYAGTPTYFGIVSEMKNPKQYTKALILCQTILTLCYTVIGVVVYYFCGQYVATPAPGSAGPLMKKVCYGLALPGLLVTCCLYTHLPAKYIFVRALRGTKHLTNTTWQHWATWFSCTAGCVVFSYIIASAIPVFGGLVGLIGALFGTSLSMQVMGMMWLYDNWEKRLHDKSWRYRCLLAWSLLIIVLGTFLMVAGTYGSIDGIIDSYKKEGGSKVWSCADNSNSV